MTPANPGTGQAARDAQQSLDLLERRLRETERWLAQTDNYRFTIQLLGTNNAEYLRDDLETIGNIVEIDRVFVYRTLANGEPSYTVLLGTYDTRSEALRELDGLPDSLRANGPYFRTIRGVKNEIARNGI
jgi:septal ring-binding cell division protein DamX